MHIAKRRLTLSLALVASLLLPSVSLAQGPATPNRDWSALKTVSTGSKLTTKLKNGKTVEGKLTSVTDSTLSLTVKGKPLDVSRDDISSVYQNSRKSATKSTLIGAAVGGGAGAGIGAAGSNNDAFVNQGAVTAGFAILGAGAGAIAGYFIGKSGRKRVLIYEAK